jgi:hypothetical protein
MLHGEIDKNKFAIRCAGVGLIIGGAYIGHTYILRGMGG